MLYKLKENRVRRSYLGGARIDKFYGKENCENGYYPEDWIGSVVEANNPGDVIVGEGLGVTETGEFVKDVLSEKGKMPFLVKLLDSAERLVIQAHPTVDFAKKAFNSEFGKTECWYFIDCDEDACVYIGFKPGITREKWEQLFHAQDSEGMLELLHKINVKKGDVVFVDGGVPHAIGGGSLILELQEPTDLMVCGEKVTPSGRVLADEKVHGGLGFVGMFDCFEYIPYTEDEINEKFIVTPAKDEGVTHLIYDRYTDKFSMDEVTYGEYVFESDKLAIVLEGISTAQTESGEICLKKGDKLLLKKGEKIILSDNGLRILICG